MAATIVVVEDEGIIAMSLQDMLEEFGYQVPAIAATVAEALAAVEAHHPDLLLLDIRLAGGDDGIALAQMVRAEHDLPVIFLTAHSDEPTVARARAVNPANFLLKPFHEREVQIAIDLALTRAAFERQLRASEQRFATTLHSIAEGVIVADTGQQITYLNPAAATITGWSVPEALGRAVDEVFRAELGGQRLAAFVDQAMVQGTPVISHEVVLTRRDGARRSLVDSIAPLADERGRVNGAVLVFQDVTEQRRAAEERQRMERRMLEAQRLESLGVMAGGIAHDFNNLLAFILGYVELAKAELPATEPAASFLAEALNGGQQATNLIKQMLAYSGKGHFQTELLDLNLLLRELHTLMQASSSRRVPVELRLAAVAPVVQAESTQLHQVMLNLLTNAAEAMEGRAGAILVTTGQVTMTADDLLGCLLGDGLPPGSYAYVRVSDAGVGMDAATLGRIFDPFFTTKFTGRGLGLAAVQGILRGHRGALRVESTPGAGSTFTVYLPLAPEGAGEPAPIREQPSARVTQLTPRQCSKVLVVDDEEGVRSMTARMLERLGYTVLVAADGPAGLAILDAGVPDLCAVVLDLTMPGMSGEEVARQIQARWPSTRIILMSGYSSDEIAQHYQRPGLWHFLQKPFTRDTLVSALRSILTMPAPKDETLS